MHALDVRSRPRPWSVSAHPELATLRHHIQRRWPDLPDPVMLEWSDTPVAAIDRSGVPWVFGPVDRDPLPSSRGGTVVPRKQLAQLKKIAKLDVPFERLAIAHELDLNGPVQSLLPALEKGPQTCTDEVARALVGPIPEHPGVARAVRALDAALGSATSGVATHLWVALRDPIIFGIVSPTPLRHGQFCLWYPLVAWKW